MAFDSIFIDVAIGIVFIYLLLSLVCTSISELISQILAIRSKTLEKSIQNLLNDPDATGLAKEIYDHPLISGLARKGNKDKICDFIRTKLNSIQFKYFNGKFKPRGAIPSYIPSQLFAIVLLDIVIKKSNKKSYSYSLDLRDAVNNMNKKNKDENKDEKTENNKNEDEETRNNKNITALLALINNANNRFDKSQENIENWFNEAMDRVSGWYKRTMQYIVIVLAILMVLTLNVDTFTIANDLASDSTLRESIIESAQVMVNQSESNASSAPFNVTKNTIDNIQMFNISWSEEDYDPFNSSFYNLTTLKKNFNSSHFINWLLLKIGGLSITVFAISLGAPFWFDSLSKLVNIRGTGKKK